MPSLASFTIADMMITSVYGAASLLAVYADAMVIRDVLAGRDGTLARLALLVNARGTVPGMRLHASVALAGREVAL